MPRPRKSQMADASRPGPPGEELRALRARVQELERIAADHARTAAALSEWVERFRTIAEYTYDVESWIDCDGRLLWVNPAVERVSGYSVEECRQMHDYPRPL